MSESLCALMKKGGISLDMTDYSANYFTNVAAGVTQSIPITKKPKLVIVEYTLLHSSSGAPYVRTDVYDVNTDKIFSIAKPSGNNYFTFNNPTNTGITVNASTVDVKNVTSGARMMGVAAIY